MANGFGEKKVSAAWIPILSSAAAILGVLLLVVSVTVKASVDNLQARQNGTEVILRDLIGQVERLGALQEEVIRRFDRVESRQ